MHKSPSRGLKFIAGGYYQSGCGQSLPLHQHPVWELVYYLEGKVECVMEKRRLRCEQGDLWLTPPRTPHVEIGRTPYRNIYLLIQAPPRAAWPSVVRDDELRNIERLCQALVSEIGPGGQPDEILSQLMLQELFRRVTRGSAASTSTSATAANLVRRAEAHFFATLDQSLSISEAAQSLGASPSHLRDAFQRVRGESPRACLRRLRCQQALHWLQHSTHTLETIATLCGFDSASHLSRVIQQEMGQRPGRLRG